MKFWGFEQPNPESGSLERNILIMRKTMSLLALLQVAVVICYGQLAEAIKLYDAKKPEESKRLLVAIKEGSPSYAAAQYYLGRIALDKKEYDEASELLEEAVDANDKVADYHYWYGTALGMIAQNSNVLKQGMLASKIKDEYEATVKLDPQYLSAYWGLIEFYTQAPGFMGGSYEKAYETARSMGKINIADGHRALGMVYAREEKFAEAEKSYLDAYKANPQYFGPIVNFYVNRKDYPKAFSFLDLELKKQPEHFVLGYQYGRCSAISGQNLDRGLAYLNKYLGYQPKENEPGHGGAHMRLGQIYEKLGKKPEARKQFESALKLDATLKEAKEGLDRVSK